MTSYVLQHDCIFVHCVCSVPVELHVISTLDTQSVGLQFSLNVHM